MTKWEYKSCSMTSDSENELFITEQLSEFGKEGWQLVYMKHTGQSSDERESGCHAQYYWAILMRETTQ